MLERLQQQLRDIYQNDPGYDVRDFLITDARLAKAISGDNAITTSGETLLFSEDEEGIALSLYLDGEMLERLSSGDPASALNAGLLNDLCKVIEGLSHFDYVAWRAHHEQSLSLLELELQAEIDKFVSIMHLALEGQDGELMNVLHSRLFEEVQFHDHLTRDQVERYRVASEYAARFCRCLKRRLFCRGVETLAELRRFYRMPLTDKISHIHSSAWA